MLADHQRSQTKALVLTSAGVVSPIPHYQHVLSVALSQPGSILPD